MKRTRLVLATSLLALSHSFLGAQETPPAAADQDRAAVAEEAQAAATLEVGHPSRIRWGGIWLGVGYHRFGRFFPYYPYGFYWPYGIYSGSLLYDPFYFPATYSQLARHAPSGQLRLRVDPPSAEVFVDGALAGSATDLEKFSLPPGAYTLRVSAPGFVSQEQRVYLLTGKKLKLNFRLEQTGETKP